MASGGFFRGTSVDQDSRFFNQNKKLLAKLKFPASFEQRVDLSKVKREVINQWIAERVTQLLGFEDDIVVAMIINLLEPKVDEKLDPKQMQLTITGFLEKDAPVFMDELWTLLLSAQDHPTGIPPAILEKKKQEMAKAAQDRQQLRQVLDRKRQDVEATGQKSARQDASKPDRQPYGLTHPREKRARGGRGQSDARGRRDRGRSASRSSRRNERRRKSPPRPAPRTRSRSSSRSASSSRSPSRSRSRTPRGRRRHTRSRSRSESRSRSNSPERRRYARGRRSRSRSLSSDHNRRERTPPRGRRRGRSSSRSRSPSLDQFGRRRRRSNSPRRSGKERGRSSSMSD